jgi:hypothetical protein
MSDQTPSPEGSQTIAQELGADPAAAARPPHWGGIEPLTAARVLRDLTREHPFAMLAAAFVAGAAYVGRRRR